MHPTSGMRGTRTTGINGLKVRRAEVPGVRLAEVTYPRDHTLAWHTHETSSITCLLAGGYIETLAKRNLDCRSGGIHLQAAGEKHQNLYGPSGARCLVLVMTPEPGYDVLPPGSGAECFASRGGLGRAVAGLLAELRCQDQDSQLILHGLTLQILGLVARRGARPVAPKRRWLRRVRERLHDDLAARLTLEGLAAEVGVSADHLSRTFRATYGSSVGEYRRQVRLDWVAERLATTDEALSELAQVAGFSDQSHMTRHFARSYGVSPGRYRALRSH